MEKPLGPKVRISGLDRLGDVELNKFFAYANIFWSTGSSKQPS